MARVQEMGKGISLDVLTARESDFQPNVGVSKAEAKPQGRAQDKPVPSSKLCPPVKRSLEEETTGNEKAQKMQRGQSARERAIRGFDDRLGPKSGPGESSGWNQSGTKTGYERIIANLAYNLKKQNNNRIGGPALHKLQKASQHLAQTLDLEFIEVPTIVNSAEQWKGMKKFKNPRWSCNLYLGEALLASVEANNKPNSKTAAAEKAVLILEGAGFTVQQVNKRSQLGRKFSKEVLPLDQRLNTRTFRVDQQNRCGAPPPTWTLENFVLTEQVKAASATSILINSAQSNHVPIRFETTEDIQTVNGKSGFVCTTLINGVQVCTGIHMNKREARNVAAENALALLRKTCPILRKNLDSAQANAITRAELEARQSPQPSLAPSAIEDSNLGHKMLKMMGWTGGALGKNGIVEPIQDSQKFSREGFGYTVKAPKNIKNMLDMAAVRRILEDYVHSGRRDDLIFTSELSQDERKAIHLACRKFNLKSQSHGSGQERFLVVKQKRNLSELVQDIVDSGGTCGQYELVTPGQS
ncbi:NF-kappa-B-repressing factor-like isoform X2 [Acanthaster planci]|nr:NF-kappa-B-repressing factor-like isoform X2 [Acanthaster planci]